VYYDIWSGMIFFSYLTDFSYFPLKIVSKSCWTVINRSKMTILKGGVDGFSYFSLISVILFSNQDRPCIIIILKYRQRRQNMLLEIFKKKNVSMLSNWCWTPAEEGGYRGVTLYIVISWRTHCLGFFHIVLYYFIFQYTRGRNMCGLFVCPHWYIIMNGVLY
jgi:hypothetical protein